MRISASKLTLCVALHSRTSVPMGRPNSVQIQPGEWWIHVFSQIVRKADPQKAPGLVGASAR